MYRYCLADSTLPIYRYIFGRPVLPILPTLLLRKHRLRNTLKILRAEQGKKKDIKNTNQTYSGKNMIARPMIG